MGWFFKKDTDPSIVSKKILAEYRNYDKLAAYFKVDFVKVVDKLNTKIREKEIINFKVIETLPSRKNINPDLIKGSLPGIKKEDGFVYIGKDIKVIILLGVFEIIHGKTKGRRYFSFQIIPGVKENRPHFLILRHISETSGYSYSDKKYASNFAEIEAMLPSIVEDTMGDIIRELRKTSPRV